MFIEFGIGINDSNKFITRKELVAYLSTRPTYLTLTTEERITKEMQYFDFDGIAGSNIYMYSYFTARHDSNSSYEFVAIIDRIEDNTFTNNTFRVYYHCDYWSTLQLNISDFRDKIFGKVERAHVNDIIKTVTGDYEPNLDSTLLDPEENVGEIECVQEAFEADYLYPSRFHNIEPFKIKFLYILFKAIPSIEYAYGSVEFVNSLHNIGSEVSVGVIPVNEKGDLIPIKYIDTETKYYNLRLINDNPLYYNVAQISDDRILGMFYSDFMGGDYEYKGVKNTLEWRVDLDLTLGIPVISFNKSQGDVYKGDYVKIGTGEFLTNMYAFYSVFNGSNTVNSNISLQGSLKIKPYTRFTKLNISSLQSSVNYYKDNGITKLHVFPYFISIMCFNNDTYPICSQYLNSDKVVIGISPNTGGFIIKYDYYNGNERYNTYYLQANDTFPPPSKETFLSRFAAITTGMCNITGSIIGVAGNVAEENVGAAASGGISLISETANSAVNIRKALIGRGVNYSPVYENKLLGITSIRIMKIAPLHKSNIDEIKEHLYRYGYNTFLEPRDILINHRRKYFNYIRTRNCDCQLKASNIAIQYINNMFNNGVWFWNYIESEEYTLFEFITANIPLSVLD